jgi:hypothetical protein
VADLVAVDPQKNVRSQENRSAGDHKSYGVSARARCC